MRTIIAPTDFSKISLNAVNYAADLSVAINAELVVLNVVQIPVTVSEVPLTEFEYEEMADAAEKELAELEEKLNERTSNKIKIHSRVIVGNIRFELKEMSKQKAPFAVVMGTRGAGLAERLFLGSHTIFAVNSLEYPVLVVPQDSVFRGIQKIAFASDLEELQSTRPLSLLKAWLETFNGTIDVVNICKSDRINVDEVPESLSLQNSLSDFSPQFHFIVNTNVEEGIYEFIEKSQPDILVVIPKKHGLLSGMFRKSRSTPLILHPHIPVLAIAE